MAKKTDTPTPTFEESMARLEAIVNQLEDNSQPLDKTIALFEEGLALVKNCDEKLNQFQSKIEEITKQNDHEE